ncbi:DUF6531 domain-containing protein, partial [Pseudomonas sp. dw_358]|uniref:RHS repeat domain-containing protein n=1 Tax=Pseudomonas sp. dw_358 TaxID=2720083 RepID=UPI001BD2DF6E
MTFEFLQYDYFSAPDYRAGQLGGAYCFSTRGRRGVNYVKGDCSNGGNYNAISGACEQSGVEILRKNTGKPGGLLSCNAPSLAVGDPIDIATGNNYQDDIDYQSKDLQLEFHRYYNSQSTPAPVWTNTFSTHLVIDTSDLILVKADGSQAMFFIHNGVISSESTELGQLSQSGSNYIYMAPTGDVQTFNSSGQMTKWQRNALSTLSLTYGDWDVVVKDDLGNSLTITYSYSANGQLGSLQADGLTVVYSYGGSNASLLSQATYTRGSSVVTKKYNYGDSTNPDRITSVIDERGLVASSWEYDSSGRVVLGARGGAIDQIKLEYNSDGTTTVTNALGKQANYKFQLIDGVKRVVAITGEPSDNCLASNSSYTYDDRGLILTKTDAKGNLTTYTYNDRGLESSRTEASGTPQSRTITTTWDPTRFL